MALAEHLGLRREQTMAFGDGLNDITMIKSAGIGVAMSNAVDEVKRVADEITATNDEDGVAAVVEGLL
jgi:hydroxymethylpyrimidine pyrophosphatase-like HAD family hydrolase